MFGFFIGLGIKRVVENDTSVQKKPIWNAPMVHLVVFLILIN